MNLTLRRVSPKVLDEVGVPDAGPVGTGVVQVGDEFVETVGDRGDRARVGAAPGGLELPCATSGLGDGRLARLVLVVDVEDVPEVGPDGRLVDLGHLGQAVPGPVDVVQTRVPHFSVGFGPPTCRCVWSVAGVPSFEGADGVEAEGVQFAGEVS